MPPSWYGGYVSRLSSSGFRFDSKIKLGYYFGKKSVFSPGMDSRLKWKSSEPLSFFTGIIVWNKNISCACLACSCSPLHLLCIPDWTILMWWAQEHNQQHNSLESDRCYEKEDSKFQGNLPTVRYMRLHFCIILVFFE